MSLESVKSFFKTSNRSETIIELSQSSATVDLAAKALGIQPEQVAKTLGFKQKEKFILIVMEGDARIDNHKYKSTFQVKAKMMTPEECLTMTSHPVGGVCPFGLPQPLEIFLDVSLQKHSYVYPAAGSANTAVKIAVNELQTLVNGNWVDVTQQKDLI